MGDITGHVRSGYSDCCHALDKEQWSNDAYIGWPPISTSPVVASITDLQMWGHACQSSDNLQCYLRTSVFEQTKRATRPARETELQLHNGKLIGRHYRTTERTTELLHCAVHTFTCLFKDNYSEGLPRLGRPLSINRLTQDQRHLKTLKEGPPVSGRPIYSITELPLSAL